MKNRGNQRYIGATFVLLSTVGLLILSSSQIPSEMRNISLGRDRLLSVESLPEVSSGGEMCQLVPASAASALQGQAPPLAGSTQDGARLTLERAPVRVIKDPYPTYSAVALDLANGEIVLQDENLFQIMVYDRSTNTPPNAAMSEPKRVIGGHHTKVEFNCGLYIDPKNGDIYSVNNDTLDTMTVFSREARGDVPPTREMETPHGTYGIAVDEKSEELFLTVQHASSVMVYPKYGVGKVKELRMIAGNKTRLADPHGVALDTKNGRVFVVNYGNFAEYEAGKERGGGGGTGGLGRIPGSGKFFPPSITSYPINADGDVAPLQTIQGPKTQLNWPGHIYIDDEDGLIYVANDGGDSVLVFKVTDNGDVAPTRIIKGPRTLIKNPTGIFVDKKNREIVVANMGNHSATVYPLDANGDVAPVRQIRGAPADQPALQIGNPGAVAYDTKRNEILVPN
jgi:6-phosphogluconolactonase (cycloisomerase 2 family)